ncbi:MAG: hypothetical protein L0207_02575 [Chlamydiae bacterium]|nr:hypothetical protein [Chlamydiota bacterium]
MKNKLICSIIIFSLIFLSAVKKHSIEGEKEVFFAKEGVFVTAKVLSSGESNSYLRRDLPAKGFQPIFLSVQNNSGHPLSLSDQWIDLPTVPSNQVVKRLMKGAAYRSIGFKVAGFFFWPFLIPGTIDTVGTFRSHYKLKKDFAAKSVKKRAEIIPPYSTTQRIIFVKNCDLQTKFMVSLIDEETEMFRDFVVDLS